MSLKRRARSHDNGNLVGEIDANHDGVDQYDANMPGDGDPMELAPGIGGPSGLAGLYPLAPRPRPSGGGGSGGSGSGSGGSGGGGGSIDFEELDNEGGTAPAGSPTCGSNGCP